MSDITTRPDETSDHDRASFLSSDKPAAPGRVQDAAALAPVHPRTLRVLVADDYADHCQSLALLVQRWGHDVRMVLDGAAALESAVDWQPDVVLADIGMPLLDGYDLAKQMRGQSCFQHTTLIAISGYADDAHRVQGIEAGYDFYLAKPAKLSQLQGILCRELGRLRLGTMLGVKATS